MSIFGKYSNYLSVAILVLTVIPSLAQAMSCKVALETSGTGIDEKLTQSYWKRVDDVIELYKKNVMSQGANPNSGYALDLDSTQTVMRFTEGKLLELTPGEILEKFEAYSKAKSAEFGHGEGEHWRLRFIFLKSEKSSAAGNMAFRDSDRSFKEVESNYHILNYGEPIPSNAVPISHDIPNEVFMPLLSRGLIPVSNPDIKLSTILPLFLHDFIGHGTGYLADKDFSHLARQISIEYSEGHDYVDGDTFAFTELITIAKPEMADLVSQLKAIVPFKASEEVSDIQAKIEQLTEPERDQLKSLLVTVFSDYDKYFLPLGGTSRDPLLKNATSDLPNEPFRRPIYEITQRIKGQKLLGPFNSLSRLSPNEAMGRFVYFLAEMSRVTTWDWYHMLSYNLEQKKDLGLFRALCKGDFIDVYNSGKLMDYVCRDKVPSRFE